MFWSPDSQFIAFFAQGKLKKIAASGGPAQTLCNVSRSPRRNLEPRRSHRVSAFADVGIIPGLRRWRRSGSAGQTRSLCPAIQQSRLNSCRMAATSCTRVWVNARREGDLCRLIGRNAGHTPPSDRRQRELRSSGRRAGARWIPGFPARRGADGPALQPHAAEPERRGVSYCGKGRGQRAVGGILGLGKRNAGLCAGWPVRARSNWSGGIAAASRWARSARPEFTTTSGWRRTKSASHSPILERQQRCLGAGFGSRRHFPAHLRSRDRRSSYVVPRRSSGRVGVKPEWGVRPVRQIRKWRGPGAVAGQDGRSGWLAGRLVAGWPLHPLPDSRRENRTGSMDRSATGRKV